MKKAFYILNTIVVMVAIGWAYLVYASYLPMYPRNLVEAALIDKTEDFDKEPTGAEILSPLNLPEHKWESIQLNIRTISMYQYTECKSLPLPGRFFLLSNPDERDKEIHRYIQQVDSTVDRINEQKNGYPKSSIYAPFIEEVNKVAATKADVKIVSAYTDCGDNTPVFSIYRDTDRDMLIHHPEKVRQLLSRYGTPGNLHGLTINIIYKPRNDKDDQLFELMSGFYKRLFEDSGAVVYIGANLNMDK